MDEKQMLDQVNQDRGPWSVGGSGVRVWLESADFTYDARLEVSGDFGSVAAKRKYAELLCGVLNRAGEQSNG